ncbi:MAG: relaxase domain-containing protein [Acidobacteriota bacterium]|nr:relaxase domain-containing protein [Acidobacteriota bacterium]
MLAISKLGTATARDYFKAEFAAASNSYFAEDGSVRGKWNGQLAERMGLTGRVTEEQYQRLIEGQHPETSEQLIKHRDTKLTREGLESSHVPAWDVNVSLPKSWSLAAIVGGDKRIYQWAEKANLDALTALETYSQAHGGGPNPNITTGAWIVATFRHETSRPVEGYGAPQIHFHNVLVNMQQVNDRFRALDPNEIYKAKSYAMQAFYDSLTRQGREGGYRVDFSEKTYAPEIRGISEAYREYESPRRLLIEQELERLGMSGGKSAKLVAERNREQKLDLTPEQFIAMQTEHGKPFADDLKVVPEALERGPVQLERLATPEAAVSHAARSLSERLATFEHYQLGREALRYSLGTVPREAIEAEIQKRIDSGTLVAIHHYRDHAPGARYATREALQMERDTVERVLSRMNSVKPILQNADLSQYPELADNRPRQQILRDILATRDQVVALNGAAGSARSTASGIIKDLAEAQGYRVRGLAPTGTATAELRDKGIASETLQMHLTIARTAEPRNGKTLYILDETSLASTKDINSFLKTLTPTDHVLLVGDDAADPKKVGQHTSVEAGRVFQLLQEAGMKTAQFNRIYRQKDLELKEVVLSFRHGQTDKALELLADQGRIHEQSNSRERFAEIARAYAESPKGTLVVSPDNDSRIKLNAAIRAEMRSQGSLGKEAYELPILVGRDLTLADARRASAYRVGDTLQYRKGNKEIAIKARDYATILDRNTDTNRLTVQTRNGRIVTYDPGRAAGVNTFESRLQEFSAGERIQFTAKDEKLGTHTRDTGTIRALDQAGNAEVVLDRNSRVLRFNLAQQPHIDHAYAMTSHSAQSKTVERVLINVDATDPRLRGLLNEVFGYVAASRPEYDLQVFADDATHLLRVLSRQNEQTKALAPEQISGYREQSLQVAEEPEAKRRVDRAHRIDFGAAV